MAKLGDVVKDNKKEVVPKKKDKKEKADEKQYLPLVINMSSFATLQDVIDLYRPLTPAEVTKTNNLLPIVSDRLRQYAINVGKDLDEMLLLNPILVNVAKSVTVDIVARTLQTPTEGAPTYLSPGGGIYIKTSELKALGLLNQRYGVIDLYGVDNDQRCNN